MNKSCIRFGKRYYLSVSIEISEQFEKIAVNDEKSADILCVNGLYNQSAYFYIQAMEKYIKSYISRKIDITHEFYADKFREMGHSLDKSVEFFIEIMTGNNPVLRSQMEYQMKEIIFKNVRFSQLHNNLRYPFYLKNKSDYGIDEMNSADCEELKSMCRNLKKYLNDAYLKL